MEIPMVLMLTAEADATDGTDPAGASGPATPGLFDALFGEACIADSTSPVPGAPGAEPETECQEEVEEAPAAGEAPATQVAGLVVPAPSLPNAELVAECIEGMEAAPVAGEASRAAAALHEGLEVAGLAALARPPAAGASADDSAPGSPQASPAAASQDETQQPKPPVLAPAEPLESARGGSSRAAVLQLAAADKPAAGSGNDRAPDARSLPEITRSSEGRPAAEAADRPSQEPRPAPRGEATLVGRDMDVHTPARASDVGEPRGPVGRATLQTLAEHTVRGVRYLVRRDEHTVTIRLIPKSLGELRLEVRSANNTVHVRLISGSSVVREALGGELPELRESLLREGVDVGRVVVSSHVAADARDDGLTHQPAQQFGNAAHGRAAPPARAEGEDPQAAAPWVRAGPPAGALDVFV